LVTPEYADSEVAAIEYRWRMKKSQHTSEYKRLMDALRQARETEGMTQADVARKLRVYVNFVTKVESGERRIDVIELKHFCRPYGVELVAFLRSAGLAE